MVMILLELVKIVTITVELVMELKIIIVILVLLQDTYTITNVLKNVQKENTNMIYVNVLLIMTVVVVNLVILIVKLVTELDLLNVLFVLKVSMLNQTPILNVYVPVQLDIGLIHYLDNVSLVTIHVLPVLVKEKLDLKVTLVCVILVLKTGDYMPIPVTNHVHPVCIWKMVPVMLVTLLVKNVTDQDGTNVILAQKVNISMMLVLVFPSVQMELGKMMTKMNVIHVTIPVRPVTDQTITNVMNVTI
jgi:hypothetical protein